MKKTVATILALIAVALSIIAAYSLVMPRVDLDAPAGQFEAFKK